MRPLVSENILVESYVSGISIKQFIKQAQRYHEDAAENDALAHATNIVNKKIAKIGLVAFLKMMLDDNFIHSDLHPGNIIVQLFDKSGRTWQRGSMENAISHGYTLPKLIFIDAGLTTTLSDTNLNNFLDLFGALADGDGELAAQLMVERSRVNVNAPDRRPEALCKDYPDFKEKMRVLVAQVQKDTFRLGNISISDLLGQVLSMVRNHHVKIESDFTNLVMSLIIVEGLGRSLDPQLDLFAAARPFLINRKAEFYAGRGGMMLKLAAYVEARFWLLSKEWTPQYAICDTLAFNNY